MTVTTDTIDLEEEAEALEAGKSFDRNRTASLLRWAITEIDRLREQLGWVVS